MEQTKVYKIKVIKKVNTDIDKDGNISNRVSEDVIKCVGDAELNQFIGYSEVKDGKGGTRRVDKVNYYKQLGFVKAICIGVTDKEGESIKEESELIEAINKRLSPIEIKSEAEKTNDLTKENEEMKAKLVAMEKKIEGLLSKEEKKTVKKTID